MSNLNLSTQTRTLYLPKVQRVTIVSTQTASPKINPYTVYVAEVKLGGLNAHTIIRRYSEFMSLHEKLETKFPNIKLYFPPKKAFGKLRNDVINQRKDQLQIFLQAIVDHPKLSTEYSVYSFLAPHLFPVKDNVPVAVSLITLPKELFLRCLLMVSFKDVLALTEVCSHLFQYITTHPTLWMYLNARFDASLTQTSSLSSLVGGSLPNFYSSSPRGVSPNNSNSNTPKEPLSTSPSPSSSPFSSSPLTRSASAILINATSSSSSSIVIPTSISCTPPNISPTGSPPFSSSVPSAQFAAFSLDNPNVSSYSSFSSFSSSLSSSSDMVRASSYSTLPTSSSSASSFSSLSAAGEEEDVSPSSSRKKIDSGNKHRGSMMLRPHVMAHLTNRHNNNNSNSSNNVAQVNPSNYVYLGAGESEYRGIFLKNVKEYHKMRITVARESKACDCVLRKLVGTIVGDPGIGKSTLLQSCLTSFSPSLKPRNHLYYNIKNEQEDNENNNNNNNKSESSLGNSGITPKSTSTPTESIPPSSSPFSHTQCHVTHIVSNGKFLCFQLYDSTGFQNDIVRHQNLSQSNFVLAAFSVVDRASFAHIKERWIPEIREYAPEVPVAIVGLQRDLRDQSDNIMPNHVPFQEAMETTYRAGGVHYLEAPSASAGVGGWRHESSFSSFSWRVNILSEIASLLLFNVNPHTKSSKSVYEEKLAFLHRLFPWKQIETIGVALASCVGDIDQAVEFLLKQGPSSPPAPPTALVLPTKIFVNEGVKDSLSPNATEAEDWRVELRQSWKMEISRMESSMRTHFINESVEAGLVVANNWDDENPEPATPKKVVPDRDVAAQTALRAQRAVYLEKLKKTSIDRFIKDFLKRKIQPKQQAEMTVSFLGEITSYVSSHTLWEDEDEKEIENMREDLERYVFSKIYKNVFAVSQEYVTKDQFFRERISKLVFITPSHLDIDEKFWNTDLWDAATYEINLMDSQKTPSDKLTCILNCCKVIIFLLTSSGDSQAGADDFLPHLIYVLIKANPKNLSSNMEFISSFCGSDVMRMEKYYYFTTLSVGVSFIENIDASSLNIDPVAFEKLMNDT